MTTEKMVIQGFIIFLSCVALYCTTQSVNRDIRRAGAVIGVLGQFCWLADTKLEQFGFIVMEVWFLILYIKILWNTTFPKKNYGVRIDLESVGHVATVVVEAESEEVIRQAVRSSELVIPFDIHVHERVLTQKILDLKGFQDKIKYLQRIQQSEKVLA